MFVPDEISAVCTCDVVDWSGHSYTDTALGVGYDVRRTNKAVFMATTTRFRADGSSYNEVEETMLERVLVGVDASSNVATEMVGAEGRICLMTSTEPQPHLPAR